MIQKLRLVNQILEEQLLEHRLIAVPTKVATKKTTMSKNNLQISMYTLIYKMKTQQKKNKQISFFLSLPHVTENRHTLKQRNPRELCSISCCSYSYFSMLLYISSCVPVSWSYMCVTSFFVCSVCDWFAKKFIRSFIH